MLPVECPVCRSENAYAEIVDENGTHYECPDCGHKWSDDSMRGREFDAG